MAKRKPKPTLAEAELELQAAKDQVSENFKSETDLQKIKQGLTRLRDAVVMVDDLKRLEK